MGWRDRVRDNALAAGADASAVIVPPAVVALVDGLLDEVRGDGLISRHRVADMLLDVRLALWKPTEMSVAAPRLLDLPTWERRGKLDA